MERLTLTGELDAVDAPGLRTQLAATGPITIDMTEVSFVDSTILDVLIRAATNRAMTIEGAQRPVQRIIEVCGLDRLLVTPPSDDART